jgi:hypothetical protein
MKLRVFFILPTATYGIPASTGDTASGHCADHTQSPDLARTRHVGILDAANIIKAIPPVTRGIPLVKSTQLLTQSTRRRPRLAQIIRARQCL